MLSHFSSLIVFYVLCAFKYLLYLRFQTKNNVTAMYPPSNSIKANMSSRLALYLFKRKQMLC